MVHGGEPRRRDEAGERRWRDEAHRSSAAEGCEHVLRDTVVTRHGATFPAMICPGALSSSCVLSRPRNVVAARRSPCVPTT